LIFSIATAPILVVNLTNPRKHGYKRLSVPVADKFVKELKRVTVTDPLVVTVTVAEPRAAFVTTPFTAVTVREVTCPVSTHVTSLASVPTAVAVVRLDNTGGPEQQ
jgi:hypothetical protein